MQWSIRGNAFRVATPEEITALQVEPGAPHVPFACRCGHAGLWSAKNLALSDDGGYNQSRNIFYMGEGRECSCPGSNLVCVTEA